MHPVDLLHRVPALAKSVTIGTAEISAGALIVVAAVIAVARLLGWLGERAIRRRYPPNDEGVQPLGARLLRGLVRIASWVFGVAFGLALADIVSLKTLGDGVWFILNYGLITIAGTEVSLATIAALIGIIAASYWLSAFIREQIQVNAEKHLSDADEDQKGRFAVLERLVHYVVVVTGVGIALQTVGINLSGLFAAGAVFAVGIGFAMQNIAQNFVSGVIVLVERAIKPGDVLVVEGKIVQVKRMGIRSTVVRTRDDEDLIVPNGILAQATVANLTFLDRTSRIRAAVGVAYESDLDRVFEVLKACARSFSPRTGREPVVLLTGFGASSIDFEVSVWTDHPWTTPATRSKLLHAMWRALKDADITIAFPQIDVHLDEPVVEALRKRAR